MVLDLMCGARPYSRAPCPAGWGIPFRSGGGEVPAVSCRCACSCATWRRSRRSWTKRGRSSGSRSAPLPPRPTNPRHSPSHSQCNTAHLSRCFFGLFPFQVASNDLFVTRNRRFRFAESHNVYLTVHTQQACRQRPPAGLEDHSISRA